MQEIFVDLTCINQTPVYSDHKRKSQVGYGLDICRKMSIDSPSFDGIVYYLILKWWY